MVFLELCLNQFFDSDEDDASPVLFRRLYSSGNDGMRCIVSTHGINSYLHNLLPAI
jgi:hypothetical protein